MDIHALEVFWVSFIIILVDFCMEAFTTTAVPDYTRLVPSQVIQAQTRSRNCQKSSIRYVRNMNGPSLIPSQVLSATPPEAMEPLVVPNNAESSDEGLRKRSRRRRRPQKKRTKAAAANGTSLPKSGNCPDTYWRSVPMEHLRLHPRFVSLPNPRTILDLKALEDVRNFRQESWQWDVLHKGRCTTSQAVAALGFLEPSAGLELGVPPSWRRGGQGAFHRLRQPALSSLDDMNKVLCTDTEQSTDISMNSDGSSLNTILWSEPTDGGKNSSGVVAAYDYELTDNEEKERRARARQFSQNEELGRSIRMVWGNTQESTSLLTAINYFGQSDPNFVVEEVGMCGAGLDLNRTHSTSSLLVGATPDGVLRHSDGRVEALEVKNHCPFFMNIVTKNRKVKGGSGKRFFIGSQGFHDGKNGGVFSHYVPQLQLEMLCLGEECKSAVMIRQTATSGALVLRMYRNDDWIDEMLYWLHRFQVDYVQQDVVPPRNFFWDANDKIDRSRYRQFINKTKELRNKVETVATVANEDIQRMGDSSISFFLD